MNFSELRRRDTIHSQSLTNINPPLTYEFNKPQWPYHCLSDWVFFFEDILHLDVSDHTTVSQTVVWSLMFRVKNVIEKKNEKIPVCGIVVWSLADRVKNLIEKKWPGLSGSDMVMAG